MPHASITKIACRMPQVDDGTPRFIYSLDANATRIVDDGGRTIIETKPLGATRTSSTTIALDHKSLLATSNSDRALNERMGLHDVGSELSSCGV